MSSFALEPEDGWPARREEGGPVEWFADRWRDADEFLADFVAVALRRDPEIHGRYLELLVQNRVVIMVGEVGSEQAKLAASRQAWSVPGVYDVSNRLIVIHK